MTIAVISSDPRADWPLTRAFELGCVALLIGQAVYLAASLVQSQWLSDPSGQPIATDFVNVWAAGREAAAATWLAQNGFLSAALLGGALSLLQGEAADRRLPDRTARIQATILGFCFPLLSLLEGIGAPSRQLPGRLGLLRYCRGRLSTGRRARHRARCGHLRSRPC